jgi:hypothetical protein
MLNIIFCIVSLAGNAQGINVKYITGENIYLDSGSADSLAVGDTLKIIRDGSSIADIEVVFVAEHSSSCRIIKKDSEISIGDKIQMIQKSLKATIGPPVIIPDTSKKIPVLVNEIPKMATLKRSTARIDGSLSVGIYRWNDINTSNLDFTQPETRLNLRGTRLWDKDLAFNLRITSLYNQRTRSYNAAIPKTEWRNRIYQASISYGSDNSPLSLQMGRIISNRLSGIGYIDGILLGKNVSEYLWAGGFGGTQPEWQYSKFQTSLQKYGAYLYYARGDYKTSRLESTVAASGEYHSSIVSREFVYLRNNLDLKGRWNIFQSAELDLNRSWRKERTGKSIELSNLFISARGRFTDWLNAGLSFDNRRNYWTYEMRSLADSLFNDILRRGFRADISIRPLNNTYILSNFGVNKGTTDSRATYSYSLGLNRSNLFGPGQYLNMQLSGFSGPFTNGYNFSSTLGHYFWQSNMISLGYGTYVYQFKAANGSRQNQYFQINSQFDLARQIYSTAMYEYDTGDDTKGHRVLAEIGYRF